MATILITGANGLLGNAIRRKALISDKDIYVFSGTKETTIVYGKDVFKEKGFDLRFFNETWDLFSRHQPTFVIHTAAKVGGIKANINYPTSFFLDNVKINTNTLEAANLSGAKKVVSVLSTCVYPEKYSAIGAVLQAKNLHEGPPHSSNYAYAYAKRMLQVQSQTYRDQYGKNFVCAVPNNLYGLNDNFDLENSHVIPAMIRKFHEASISGETVKLWGDGSPLREFTFADDIAEILFFILENYNSPDPINIGSTEEVSIKVLAEMIQSIGYENVKFEFGGEVSNGIHRKSTNNYPFKFLWKSDKNREYTSLRDGLTKTIDWFKVNYPNVRGLR